VYSNRNEICFIERGADVLKLKVREVAEAQGLTSPVDLASRTKIAYATAYRLWQGDAGTDGRGVGVLVLYKVARALGVKLWDLVEDVPEGALAPAMT
jgi:transcriptional regulator with XRE-family HTH domain